MVYLLTWVGGVGCPVLNGPVTCVIPGLWGMSTTLCSSARLLESLRAMARVVTLGSWYHGVLLSLFFRGRW
jgi:hypothetical protein